MSEYSLVFARPLGMQNNALRMTLDDTAIDSIVKLAEGNPGGLNVMMQIMKVGSKIDPDNMFGGLGVLMDLDMYGIYGSRIWMLYKDVCGQDVAKTIGLVRATQMGIISDAALDHAIDNRGAGIDVDATLAALKARIPNFNA